MDDSGIIALYWARDERAIPEKKGKYGALCLSIARNILGSESDAEECENDVYLAAWKAIPPARPESLRAFLGRIARNLSLNRYDYLHAQKRGGGMETLLSELSDCLAAPEGVEDALSAKEAAEAVNRFLRTLPERERTLFLRRYWYCDSVRAAAKRLGITESAAKSRLLRTRERLRAFLQKEDMSL